MSLRIFSAPAIAIAALTGCGPESGKPEGETIACAIGQGADFSNVCTLEIIGPDNFVIYRPDGGFRRFVVMTRSGGPVVEAIDGADPVNALRFGDESEVFEFAIAGERYQLDLAKVRGSSNE